tara:strand:- start:14031 stop:15107 length:1077 start_codon:yes stop_codon:yes gene_type:complete
MINYDELRSKAIGYTPVDQDFSTAGDRRRFIYYANQSELNWEPCQLDKNYDILYVTTIANMSDWISYKKSHPKTVLIFDINNSFFFNQNFWWNFARGFSRFISRRESKFYSNYNNVYHEMFKYADIVVCPTESAKEYISKFNSNVHIPFDFFEEDITIKKSEYTNDHPLVLVWEGMGVTAKHLLTIAPVLEKFQGKILLKIVSDRSYKYGLLTVDVPKIFKGLKCDYEFIDWEKDSFSKHIVKSDLAIIPLDKSDKVALHKPENKLILLWQHGIPVITTDTPAYVKSFSGVDYNLTCGSLIEWEKKLELFISGKFDSRQHMDSVKNYLQKYRSREQFMMAWDRIFKEALTIGNSEIDS